MINRSCTTNGATGACRCAVAEGNVGGGAGMATYEFKGGTGTSSRRLQIAGQSYTVGALVQSNFGKRGEFSVLGVPVGRHISRNAILSDAGLPETGSIIVIIGSDVPLLPIQLRRLAKRGALGIGRTGSSGGHYSGDLILAFSVANPMYFPAIGERQPRTFNAEWLNDAHCDALYEPAVAAVEEALLNALLAAQSVPTFKPAGLVLEALMSALSVVLARTISSPCGAIAATICAPNRDDGPVHALMKRRPSVVSGAAGGIQRCRLRPRQTSVLHVDHEQRQPAPCKDGIVRFRRAPVIQRAMSGLP
ncbi:MAG: P1 family peptidase [Steroidobacteraceae bacterium]